MSIRLIEIFIHEKNSQEVLELLQNYSLIETWKINASNNQNLIKVLLFTQEAEAVIDQLEIHFSHSQQDSFRILLLSVEAAIPRPTMPNESVTVLQESASAQFTESSVSRVNRQELYETVAKTVVLTRTHILMVVLSTTIAAIGLLRNNGTILIGAMVIAPLLGPNMALALAITLGDIPLARRALKIGGVGIGIALTFSVLVGWVFPVSPEIPEIAFRTRVHGSDLILAFASGMAGALSFTSGGTSAIVGVMVAVALLPPLVTFGMLLGSGHLSVALGAMLLFLTNAIGLNVAAAIAFLVQKIQPGKWWEADQAKKITRVAFWLWLVLLSALMFGIGLWWRTRQA